MRTLYISTDKTIIPKLPRYTFEGKIYIIQSEREAERAVAVLRKSAVLGIDTETRPMFRKGEHRKVALLQIANDELCFLFRINETGFLPSLVNLLSDPDVLKVGLSLKDDFMMLRQRVQDFRPQGYVELQQYAKEIGIQDMSLQKLYANVFGKRISKGAQLSNWEADVLNESQKTYAATDAYTCLQLYKELKRLKETKDYQLIECQPDITTT